MLTEAPLDGSHGTWVVWSERGTPRPWVEMPFHHNPALLPLARGVLMNTHIPVSIPSFCTHNGGGVGKNKIKLIAFFTLEQGGLII